VREAQWTLSPGWVAGSVRARSLLSRRIGREQARAVAGSASLEDALGALSGSAYGRFVRPGMGLARAQRAAAETVLWHIRVLAGWAPPGAQDAIRALAAWFELANIEDRLAFLAGGEPTTPFTLGGLATAWPRLAEARTVAEVRDVLAGSPWGDPGGREPADVRLGLRLAWGRRVLQSVPDAGDWAAGAVALLVARELFLAGRSADDLATHRPPGIGLHWAEAGSLRTLREALPAQSAWALGAVEEPADLWRAEVAWWRRVEQDAESLVHAPLMGEPMVIGSVVGLGVDAWRTAAALESAARGGTGESYDAFEAVA
jgi:hypothetical protein